MTTREIVATFKEMYDAVSPPPWYLRSLTPFWSKLSSGNLVLWMKCIPLFTLTVSWSKFARTASHQQVGLSSTRRQYGRSERATRHVVSENEGAKFWLNVLTELQNRGVKDILIVVLMG
nr:putative truncated transposase [Vibrio cholerae non-O1/non-O139]